MPVSMLYRLSVSPKKIVLSKPDHKATLKRLRPTPPGQWWPTRSDENKVMWQKLGEKWTEGVAEGDMRQISILRSRRGGRDKAA